MIQCFSIRFIGNRLGAKQIKWVKSDPVCRRLLPRISLQHTRLKTSQYTTYNLSPLTYTTETLTSHIHYWKHLTYTPAVENHVCKRVSVVYVRVFLYVCVFCACEWFSVVCVRGFVVCVWGFIFRSICERFSEVCMRGHKDKPCIHSPWRILE